MKRNSKRFKAAIVASEKGFRVDEENIIYGVGGNVIKGYNKKGYIELTVTVEGRSKCCMLHHIVAINKFGVDAVAESQCIRHMDGDSLNNRPSNLRLGTFSENMFDKPKEVRLEQSHKASMKKVRKDWVQIDADREAGMSYNELGRKYGVSKSTLSYRYNQSKKIEKNV